MDENAVIVILFVGYETKDLIAFKADQRIILRVGNSQVDEIKVTTVYGIEQSKEDRGYAVATVTGAEINKANSGSILNGLIAKVSGLNIDVQSSSMAAICGYSQRQFVLSDKLLIISHFRVNWRPAFL